MLITNAIISFYCACSICCGTTSPNKTTSGVYPLEGRTIATGQREIKLGSSLIWQGKTFKVEDRMHKRYDRTNEAIYHFDVFINDHKRALKLGRLRNQQVTIK